MDQSTLGWWLGQLLGPYGMTVGLLILVYLLLTERLVPGPTCRRLRDERDAALHTARRGERLTGQAVSEAKKK